MLFVTIVWSYLSNLLDYWFPLWFCFYLTIYVLKKAGGLFYRISHISILLIIPCGGVLTWFLCPHISCKLVVGSRDLIKSRFDFLTKNTLVVVWISSGSTQLKVVFLFVMFSANDDHFLDPIFIWNVKYSYCNSSTTCLFITSNPLTYHLAAMRYNPCR